MANSRPFMDFLREHRSGVTHDELSVVERIEKGGNVAVLDGLPPQPAA